MNAEKALIARARPHIIATKLKDVVGEEICKGVPPPDSPHTSSP